MKIGTSIFSLSIVFLSFLLHSCSSPMSKLEPRVLEFKSKFPNQLEIFQSINRQMSYAWSGNPNNQALIFVHGSPGGWDGWVDFLLNQELQKKYHVIAIDRPGYGGSGEGQSELSLKRQAEDIITVLKFNNSGKKAILVGHSYGGAVIAQIASDNPEKVATIIFVPSSVNPDLEKVKWFQFPAKWWPIRSFIPDELRVCNEEIMALKNELQLLNPKWINITANVGTIQGDKDNLVPLENQDFILSKINPTQVKFKERVTGMNHFVPWEHPELILKAINKLGEDL